MNSKTKLLTLLLAFSSTVIFAQTPSQTPTTASPQTPTIKTEKQQDMKDLRHDIRSDRKERIIRKHDVKTGNTLGAKDATRDIKADNKDIASDRKELRSEGVKHPVRRAHREIRHRRH